MLSEAARIKAAEMLPLAANEGGGASAHPSEGGGVSSRLASDGPSPDICCLNQPVGPEGEPARTNICCQL